MNSWDKYYQEFKSELLRDRRLIVSLKDNEESKKLLNQLGYKFDPEVDHIDNCKIGGYYFWTANIYLNYDDDDDTEIDVIDIHHSISRELVINYETNGEEWLFPLIEKWFGIKKEYIANTAIADGMPDLYFLSSENIANRLMTSLNEDLMSSLYDYIKVNYEYKLNLSENDIDEIIEDLKEFSIDSIEKFENRIIYAGKVSDDIDNHASKLYAEKNKLDPNKFYKLENIDYTDYLFFFEGKLEKRKPVSEEAFSKILKSYHLQLWQGDIRKVLYPATILTLVNIAMNTAPDVLDPDEFDDFIDEQVKDTYDNCTSSVEGLTTYIKENILDETDEDRARYWMIGDTYELDGEIGSCDYEDYESFIYEVNFTQVIKILQKCWDRACKTEEVFPEDEAMNDRRNGFIAWE